MEHAPRRKAPYTRRQFLQMAPAGAALAIGAIGGAARVLGATLRGRRPPIVAEDSIYTPDPGRYGPRTPGQT